MKGDAPLNRRRSIISDGQFEEKKAQLPLDFGGVKDSIECVL